jgi:hypothetical protein
MKPIRPHVLPFVLALTAASATAAHAQLNLAWNNCITQAASAADKSYACDGSANGIPYKVVMSFVAPANLNNFVGLQAIVDIRTATGNALTDWWKIGVGECRDGNFFFPGTLTGVGTGTTGVCRNPFAGANSGGGFQWYTQTTDDYPTINGARTKLAIARDTEGSLTQAQQYVAGAFTLDTFNDVDTGNGVCAGCALPACIVLNQIELYQTVGSPGGDIIVLNTPATRFHITWQGGAVGGNGCPIETPVRRATWGGIKSLYH